MSSARSMMTCVERLARIVIRHAEIRSVFLAYDGILRECLVQITACAEIVGHFFFFQNESVFSRPEPQRRPQTDPLVLNILFCSWHTSYRVVVALDNHLACSELVEDHCGWRASCSILDGRL
jgi:hypothetical protein